MQDGAVESGLEALVVSRIARHVLLHMHVVGQSACWIGNVVTCGFRNTDRDYLTAKVVPFIDGGATASLLSWPIPDIHELRDILAQYWHLTDKPRPEPLAHLGPESGHEPRNPEIQPYKYRRPIRGQSNSSQVVSLSYPQLAIKKG